MLKSYLAFTSAVHHVLTRAYERLGAAPPSADAHAHAAESVLGHGAPERKDLLGGDDDE